LYCGCKKKREKEKRRKAKNKIKIKNACLYLFQGSFYKETAKE
jgi:hypothetical protein